MELEYLRFANSCCWTGGYQYHIDVRDGIIHYRLIVGNEFFNKSLEDLSWISKYEAKGPDCGWSADTLREGIYKGDSVLWLKIFEKIHIEHWKPQYHAWVLDGVYSRCLCKFKGDDKRYDCKAEGVSPDTMGVLYNLLNWLDADHPQPVYGEILKFEASLYDCTGEKLLERLIFERSDKTAIFMKDSGTGLGETDRLVSDKVISCLSDWQYQFSVPINRFEKFDRTIPADMIEYYDKVDIPIPEDTPILEICATFEIGARHLRLRFHRGAFDKFWMRIVETIGNLFDKRGKMLFDDRLYYHGYTKKEAVYYNLSIPYEYDCILPSYDDELNIGDEVMFKPNLNLRRRSMAKKKREDLESNHENAYQSQKEQGLWRDDQVAAIEALICLIDYKSYQDKRGFEVLPTLPKRVPLNDDEIIYCILSTDSSPYSDEYFPEYYWTRREDVHIGTKVCVPVNGVLTEAGVYEMRVYKTSHVPVPLDEVKCLDAYL